ncbi:hypothetical protein TNCV_3230821 [Trichonephila clavipes]|nr:hypothetical protein TNCV_3230821 [Trichonephila clavipes]
MANSSSSSSNFEDFHEKLYVDSYYNFLKNKKHDAQEAANALRHLIREVNIHCTNLNISESSSQKLSEEFCTEYFDIVDDITHPSLLPVYKDEIRSENSSEEDQNFTLKKTAIERINTYVSNLKIDLPPCVPSAPLFEQNVHQNISQSIPGPSKKEITLPTKTLPKSNFQSNLSSSASRNPCESQTSHGQTFPNSLTIQKKPCIQSKFYSTGLSKKRVAVENESNSGHIAKRYNNCSKNLSMQTKNEQQKGSGFVSASSMYRNPMKKKVMRKNQVQIHHLKIAKVQKETVKKN